HGAGSRRERGQARRRLRCRAGGGRRPVSIPSGPAGGGLPRGVWIGVDVGTVRVGVARSDPSGLLASPVETLARDRAGDRDVRELAALVEQTGAVGVVVGLPRTLAGRE